MRYITILILGLLLAAQASFAQDRPTSAEALKVIDYYYNGKGQGAVLMDSFLCQQVGKEGALKNECLNKAAGQVPVGQEVYLWMNYLVPVGDHADIIINFIRQGKVRHTARVKLAGAMRYRIWKKAPTDKAGQWNVSIIQELENKDLEIGTLKYTVGQSKP